MNNLYKTNNSHKERLDFALDTLYAEAPDEITEQARTHLISSLQKTKAEALLYGTLNHPMISALFLAIRNNEVVRVDFGITENDFIQQISEQFKAPLYFDQEETAKALQQIQDYLDGKCFNLKLPTNISILTKFQQQVLQATQQIPRGKIVTYLEIARKIGNPNAVRAVGQALGRNPIPIVIPCHRVIASNGSLGGYSGGGGIATKARLLQLEGVSLL